MHRREYLGGLATVGLVTLSGCSDVVQSLAESTPEDVNVFSEIDDPVTIPVTIDGPGGETVFEESPSFDSEGTEQYESVWETTGDYTVSAAVEFASSRDGQGQSHPESHATETVTIPHRDASLIVRYRTDGFVIGMFEDRS